MTNTKISVDRADSGGEKFEIKMKPCHQIGSPHDRFGRKAIGDPKIAGNLLKYYGDPAVAEFVDLSTLKSQETHQFTKELKELISDISFLARFQDAARKSEILFVFEHKSQPTPFVVIQSGAYSFLSLYKAWIRKKWTRSKMRFKPPIPITVLLYCGKENIDGLVRFQDIFGDDIPKELEKYVPQFEMLVINLRKFGYDNLPGDPVIRSIVEAMKRAFDGTFAKNLDRVIAHLAETDIDVRIEELIIDIVQYCAWTDAVSSDQITRAITTTVKGRRGIQMSQMIQKGLIKESYDSGYVTGEAKGRIKEKSKDIVKVLRNRFKQVPKEIVGTVNKMSDLTALNSYFDHALNCSSLDEFADSLK